jgi:proline racemase
VPVIAGIAEFTTAYAKVGCFDAIVPSIEGWARVTGFNTIVIDDRDPFALGFQVTDQRDGETTRHR